MIPFQARWISLLSLVWRFHESTNRPATRGAANRIAGHQGVLGCWRELGGRVPGDDRPFWLPGTSLEKVRQLETRMKLPASFQPWCSPSRLCVRATSRRAFEVQAFHREEGKEIQRAYFSLQMKISTENVFYWLELHRVSVRLSNISVENDRPLAFFLCRLTHTRFLTPCSF